MGSELFVRYPESHDCNWDGQISRAVDHLEGIEASIEAMVLHATSEHGASWADIGRLLGVSRQAARQRFANR